jgi:hypothetical protein
VTTVSELVRFASGRRVGHAAGIEESFPFPERTSAHTETVVISGKRVEVGS